MTSKSKHSKRIVRRRRLGKPRVRYPRGSTSPSASLTPLEMYVRLKYVQQVTLNATTSSTDNYVFRANDLYDPDYTGTGHQPLGYDQWTLFYERWVVEAAHVQFTCTPPNLSTATPQINNAMLFITVRGDYPTAVADINTAIEDPLCVVHKMTTGYQAQPVLRARVHNPTVLGVAKATYMNSVEYSGAIGTSPTIQTYFLIGAGSALSGGSIDPDPIYCTVEIDYFVKFFGRYVPAGSSYADDLVRMEPGLRQAQCSDDVGPTKPTRRYDGEGGWRHSDQPMVQDNPTAKATCPPPRARAVVGAQAKRPPRD